MGRYVPVLFAMLLIGCAFGSSERSNKDTTDSSTHAGSFEVQKTAEEWEAELDRNEFHILREKGTERAFSGDLWDHKANGTYTCAACGQALFESETKFKSGTGWPSYYQPTSSQAIHTETDVSFGMARTEVMCGRCGGHLGHVFKDGPKPTGLRYCINSASLDFEAEAEK